MKKNQLFLLTVLVGIFMLSCQSNQKKSEAEKIPFEESAVTSSDWISIFNGKDLESWTVRGKAEWKVEDGIFNWPGSQWTYLCRS